MKKEELNQKKQNVKLKKAILYLNTKLNEAILHLFDKIYLTMRRIDKE